ncbi:myb/sant-like dna-binding domain [Holotrichia oblita]|uniref:Myb/sant-like dna-binding domain n=1 Tax=Holotrichia oblita TaxID=644536 RepID=A0ACB9SFW4_HOLOL|nr:myb/sant-like dna-binding domain [Holotrichia oblita]
MAGKRKCLSLKEKLEIIEESEKNGLSTRKLAEKFKVDIDDFEAEDNLPLAQLFPNVKDTFVNLKQFASIDSDLPTESAELTIVDCIEEIQEAHETTPNSETEEEESEIVPVSKISSLSEACARVAGGIFEKASRSTSAGKFTNSFTKANARDMWQQITVILNATPGARKDWSQWRKTWHDLRCNAKNKKSEIIRHQRGTGGGSPLPPEESLSVTDKIITEMIGPTAISGDQAVPQLNVNFDFEPQCEYITVTVVDDEKGEKETNKFPQQATVNLLSTPRCGGTSSQAEVKTKRWSKRGERSQQTVATCGKLADQNQQQLDLMRHYYMRKLEIMEQDLLVIQNISETLKSISEYFKDEV